MKANIDFGAIFLAEDYQAEDCNGLQLATQIRKMRPELPIFFRTKAEGVAPSYYPDHTLFRSCYTAKNIDDIEADVQSSIFSLVYPHQLVRGITELTKSSLSSQFKGLDIASAHPQIVRDRIMYGELFTLIPLESDWCRGYMLLQTNQAALHSLVEGGKTHLEGRPSSFREINDLLGEITNLVWGSFKNRFFADGVVYKSRSEVPIIVNHLHRFISFGSEEPQLCFKYTLTDPAGSNPPLILDQRFVFNMDWSPEKTFSRRAGLT